MEKRHLFRYIIVMRRYLILMSCLFATGCQAFLSQTAAPTPQTLPVDNNNMTILFYLAAENSLEDAIVQDLQEIVDGISKTAGINALVLFDRDDVSGDSNIDPEWTGTRLFVPQHSFEFTVNNPYLTVPPPEISVTNMTQYLLPAVSGADKTLVESVYQLQGDRYVMDSSVDLNTLRDVLVSCGYLLDLSSDTSNLQVSDGQVLRQFVSYARDQFRSERFGLVIGSHASGWFMDSTADLQPGLDPLAKIVEDTSNNTGSHWMEIYDLRQALSENNVEFIFMDVCQMGDVESAWELKDVTDYLVFSQLQIPANGLNYSGWLQRISAAGNPTTLPGKEYARLVVDQYAEDYADHWMDLSVSALDLGSSFASFVQNLQTSIKDTTGDAWSTAAGNSPVYIINTAFSLPDDHKMIDLFELLSDFGDSNLLSPLQDDSIIFNTFNRNVPVLKGLSIYKPDSIGRYNLDKAYYQSTRFASDFPDGWRARLEIIF
jgi:hypothetical protein